MRTPTGTDTMRGAYLGPSYSDEDVAARLKSVGARYQLMSEESLVHEVARRLAAEQAVGWFQGRMEFGPRALGARSILGDARSPTMQKMLNLKVKYRESFRPSRRRCCANMSPTGSSSTATARTCCSSPASRPNAAVA
jgi:carbamoyltransferase